MSIVSISILMIQIIILFEPYINSDVILTIVAQLLIYRDKGGSPISGALLNGSR
jgi:hypothetical protein